MTVPVAICSPRAGSHPPRNHLHAVVLETPCFFAQADNFVRDPDINP
jgi:hypothetical protein